MNKRIKKKKGLLKDPDYEAAEKRWIEGLDQEICKSAHMININKSPFMTGKDITLV